GQSAASPASVLNTSLSLQTRIFPSFFSCSFLKVCAVMGMLLARVAVAVVVLAAAAAVVAVDGQMSPAFYDATCPALQSVVRRGMAQAVQKEARMGASILRLFFHDCFVNVRFGSGPSQIKSCQLRAETCMRRGATPPSCWTTRPTSRGRRTRGPTPTRCADTRSSMPSRRRSRLPARPPSPAPTSSRSPPATPSAWSVPTSLSLSFWHSGRWHY
uniref:Plant heme peroxidase family profile domain-containing protein n=1 Tax=Aegilops tauschii subsp. strangulata TaxID=200361 RepID=A0A453ECL7_AEGTS